jgi:hypothetical protein
MATERADTVAIMAAIIYAGRTGESAQAPNEKVFGVVAKAAWELHKAVVRATNFRSVDPDFSPLNSLSATVHCLTGCAVAAKLAFASDALLSPGP